MWSTINETISESICSSPFWDTNRTWNSADPDFTICFEKTALVWFPCLFLWLCLPLEIHYLRRTIASPISFNSYNILKLLAIATLGISALIDIGNFILTADEKYAPVDIYTPLLKLSTFALFWTLTLANIDRGIRSSGALFLFSFLLVLCGTPQLRTEIRSQATVNEEKSRGIVEFISYLLYYLSALVVFALNCFADAHPNARIQHENLCPEKDSSFLSKFVFAWFDKFAWKGYGKKLTHNDLWDLDDNMRTTQVVKKFESNWQRAKNRCRKSNARSNGRVNIENQNLLDSEIVQEYSSVDDNDAKEASIVLALWRTFRSSYFFGAIFRLVHSCLALSGPLMLNLIIEFVDNPNDFPWRGFLYSIVLLIVTISRTLFLNQHFLIMFRIGLRMRAALVSVVYKKALKLSNGARKDFTLGEITNFMSVDAERVPNLIVFISLLWSAPLEVCIATYFLWDLLGPSVLVGLTILIVVIPLNAVLISNDKKLQTKQMERKDQRVKLMSEILSGIRVLKLYAWEPSFQEQIVGIRDKEIDIIKRMAYIEAGESFLWAFAPILISLITLATYVLSSDKHALDARIAFVSLSLFNALRGPLSMLPWLIIELGQTWISMKRIRKFLHSEELDSSAVSHEQRTERILIENGQFSWESCEGPSTLHNICVKVNPGQLVAVVGAVGSGKSSLLSAMLGEMYKQSGFVNTTGTLAYVPQQAWIQNATFEANITFGETTRNKPFYDQVIQACALKADLEILPARDQTEIGEKGINLSGGQKQRISLARAVYSEADTYLLDDPLSAVDAHVGKHIFEQVIGSKGLLKEKTRILVTHNVTYLPHVDYIIVLKNGTISEGGTYEELVTREGDFSSFLATYAKDGGCGVSEDENIVVESDTGEEQQQQTVCRNGGPNFTTHSKTRNSISESGDGSFTAEEVIGRTLIEAEENETGNVKFDVYKYYLTAMGFFLGSVTILLNLAQQGFIVASGYWLSVWSSDTSIAARNDGTNRRDKEYFYLGVYALLGIGQAVSIFAQTISLYLGALKASKSIHNYLLTAVLRWPALTFDKIPTGRILNRFSSDMNTLDRTLTGIVFQFLLCTALVMSTLYVISYSTPIFIVVIVPLAAFYYVVQRFFVATSRQLRRLESMSKSPIYSHFGETYCGAQSIRAYNLQSKFVRVSESKIDVNQKSSYLGFIANRWLSVRLELVGSAVTFCSALFAVLARDTLSVGLVGLSVSYAIQITNTMYLWVRMVAETETSIVAVERVKAYVEAEQEAPWSLPEDEEVPENWPSEGEIVFQDLEVRYQAELPAVLKRINFRVKSGERVGIVGRTGAGKSSLTLSLFRIVESCSGKILIDDVDITKIGLHTLRGRLTIIPQDPVLFTGTLRMNLDPAEERSDESLWRALEMVNLKTYVSSLHSGLQYEVSEGGSNFSVGQRQLICLARALLRKTKVLILDEATASVDLETDDQIQNTIRREFKGSTVLTIAHRLKTVQDYDRIMVLDRGAIVEYDSPSVLMESEQSVFCKMARDAGLTLTS